ncbi:MAG: helix-turn-helix transcriptional regulator [Chloroflexi bacterium]|nr:helix-turn-helix transcriptional regulator [Chloroflexota bacterium]MBV9601736.1 helix-turn-helix transcriptional regulator [Chloroflexota bacterium]
MPTFAADGLRRLAAAPHSAYDAADPVAAVLSFAELLRQHRLSRGLTQAQLAERSALSWRSISDLERALEQSPRSSTVRLLAREVALPRRKPRTCCAPPSHIGSRRTTGLEALATAADLPWPACNP